MTSNSTPPLPKQWFQVHTHKGNGVWFVATAGPKRSLVEAQAKGVAEKNGVAVIVKVSHRVLRRAESGGRKRRSTPVTSRSHSARKRTASHVAEGVAA